MMEVLTKRIWALLYIRGLVPLASRFIDHEVSRSERDGS
jgi:hypothetical protein